MLLENILENTMAGYWDWFIKEDYEYMSPTFKKMFGYDDDELPNKPESWQKIIHPDDLSGVFEVFEKHVQTKGEFPFDNEVRYWHKNGSVVWVYCKGKVIEWDENGDPVRMVGSHINITELKEAEEQLKIQTEELSQALEDLARTQTDLAKINKILKEEIKERKRAEVVLREHAVVVLAGGLLLTFLALTYFFTNIRHTARIESQVEERTAEVVQTNKALEEEISVRRRAEEELKDKEMLLENILENTMAGYWDWFIKEDYEYMSPTFKKMFGYDDDELPNKPESWQKIIHPDDLSGVFEVFEKHVQTKGEFPFDNEVRYWHKNGSVVWVYCKGKVIEWDENGDPVRMVGSHINITELKEAEEQLKIQTEELSQALEDLARTQTDLAKINKILKEEIKERKRAEVVLREHAEKLARSNEELEQFAYVASHDLQEPLRKVTNFSELLAKKYSNQLDSKADRYIHYVVDGAARMQTLIRDLLSFSRVGQVESKIEPMNLESALSEALSTLDISIQESKAEITFDSLPEVNVNPGQITQLFQNLIANAIRYRSEEKPRIKISAEQQNSHWQISVSDNGIGIGPEYCERIFVIFQRLHTREEYTGTGVGLAICKKIVERHGGRILVESKPGKGSTFFFTIYKKLENRKANDRAPEIQVIDDDLSGVKLTAK